MPHNNPWYLITEDEIRMIERYVELIRHHVPEQDRAAIIGTLGVLTTVQERVP